MAEDHLEASEDPTEQFRVPRGSAHFEPGAYYSAETLEIQDAKVHNGRVVWFSRPFNTFTRVESTDSAQASLIMGSMVRGLPPEEK